MTAPEIVRRTFAGDFISIWDAPIADDYEAELAAAKEEILRQRDLMPWGEWIIKANHAIDIVERMRKTHWSRI